MKILVTGGAGYIGCVMVPTLLAAGHYVTVFDNLSRGGQGLLPYFSDPRLRFVFGDVRDESAVRSAIAEADVVIHLAAVVGFPACQRDPWAARQINVDGTLTVCRSLGRGQVLLFASSLSNYGTTPGEICTEETVPRPITLYGMTKIEAESRLLEHDNAIVFRPATAFGLSSRMRLDLLFNDFVYTALRQKRLVVYESEYYRAFIHVKDFAAAFLFAIQHNEKMKGQIYNLGDESLNLTKGDLALRISQRVGCEVEFSTAGKDPDQRNYRVSFEKLRSLGFRARIGVDAGIDELVRGLPVLAVQNPYSNAAN